ncbi:primosomal protein [Isoptericola jiangsuensis]|uniref:primosomal protein n=1 Tax=Isoptericola jiangsuensis TaxID=548579 RepID=UPI003AAD0A9F
MTADPRAALDRFVAALEGHLHAVATRRGDDDPAVDDAYEVLADAFEVYEDSLAQVYTEVTPFYLDDDGDDDEDDEDDLDDELDDVEVSAS